MKIKLVLQEMLEGDIGSEITIAVGYAEGTRTKTGGFLSAYKGHKDPGNGAHNQGSFSYQHEAKTPQIADLLQIEKLRTILLPSFLDIAIKSKWDKNKSRILFAIACDLFTQSEAACLDKEGFLDQIWNYRDFVIDQTCLVEWRCVSYFDPATKALNAPGFGNNIDRLRSDQLRRTIAVLDVIF
jgi:hypothetical protein